jgi:hypothetical protein
LGRRPVYRTKITGFRLKDDGSVELDMETQNIDHLRFALDGVRVMELPIKLGAAGTIFVPPPPGNAAPATLRVEGFELLGEENSVLRAVRTVILRQPDPPQPAPVLQGDIDPITGQPAL